MSTTYPHFDATPLIVSDHSIRVRPISIAAGSTVLRGSILGEIGSTGTYILSVAAATDGSQKPSIVAVADVDATAGAVATQGYVEGDFADCRCVFGAGHTADTVNTALREATINIYIRKLGATA